MFGIFFQENNFELNELESRMLSGLFVDFITYYIEHNELEGNYSTIVFESFFNITLHFFQLNRTPEASDKLLDLIKQYSGTQPSQ